MPGIRAFTITLGIRDQRRWFWTQFTETKFFEPVEYVHQFSKSLIGKWRPKHVSKKIGYLLLLHSFSKVSCDLTLSFIILSMCFSVCLSVHVSVGVGVCESFKRWYIPLPSLKFVSSSLRFSKLFYPWLTWMSMVFCLVNREN